MPLGEWELWACAQKVIDDHGVGAVAHAERRMLELLAAGDEAGALTWTAIAMRIEELESRKPSSAAKLN